MLKMGLIVQSDTATFPTPTPATAPRFTTPAKSPYGKAKPKKFSGQVAEKKVAAKLAAEEVLVPVGVGQTNVLIEYVGELGHWGCVFRTFGEVAERVVAGFVKVKKGDGGKRVVWNVKPYREYC